MDNERERLRLQVLRRYEVLDTEPEAAFDEVTRLAARLCAAPLATLTLLDECRQWFKATVGLPREGTDRAISFCSHAIEGTGLFEVPDARQDPRFADNPLVHGEPFIRFYAGIPLVSAEGAALGTLAVLDRVPRHLSAEQRELLTLLGRQAMAELELRLQRSELRRTAEVRAREQQLTLVQKEALEAIAKGTSLDAVLTRLLTFIEAHSPGVLGSILFVDADGRRLRHAAAPSLPAAYCAAIDGAPIGPSVGSCGTAAFTAREVIVTDIQTDPLWKDYHPVASAHGLRACWSSPILAGNGRVLGTFALYNRKPGHPAADERETVAALTHLAGIAIERHASELALRKSEERFRELAETIEDVFWSWDVETGRILYISPSYEKLFGRSREALYADTEDFLRAIHPDDVKKLMEALARDRFSIMLDYRVVRPDGTVRWVGVRTFPVADAHGRVLRTAGIARDVTKLKEAGDQLRASAEQYRLLFNHNPHPMWVYELGTLRFLAVNAAAIAHYGYSEQEFLGMTLPEIRPPEEVPRFLAFVATLTPERKTRGMWRHRRKDGSIIDVELSSDEIDFLGTRARLVLANDITGRLQAEARVREQAALLDKAQDAILLRDLEGRITYWNRSAERLFGWTAAEAAGRSAMELLNVDHPAFLAATTRVNATGEWMGELTQRAKDGRALTIEARWTLVRDDAGEPRSILAINTDITERKVLEAQFLRAQRMESIGTLAGGIAHDLNNVLTPILMSVELFKLDQRTDEELQTLDLIENSARRGADLVRQVLTFARGAGGQRVKVDLARVVRDIERLARETFDKNIRVACEVDPALWSIVGDATQIHQILLNLCVNARDAMPDGGTLRLSASNVALDRFNSGARVSARPGVYVLLQVGDTGSGIPLAVRDRIFDPFFTTKEVGKGTGLGLATVQALVKSHGGHVTFTTEEGRGTAFEIYLPVSEATAVEMADTTVPLLPHGKGEQVLVVDDEPAVRALTQRMLETFGYRVMVAPDGAAGLALFKAHQGEIQLVLTDMMMPVMDGVALSEALRAIDPQIKIIGASGLNAQDTAARAAKAGVKHLVPKPYTVESILTTLAATLREP